MDRDRDQREFPLLPFGGENSFLEKTTSIDDLQKSLFSQSCKIMLLVPYHSKLLEEVFNFTPCYLPGGYGGLLRPPPLR